jgi:uncharacterized protein YgfB (UPF0149 family)
VSRVMKVTEIEDYQANARTARIAFSDVLPTDLIGLLQGSLPDANGVSWTKVIQSLMDYPSGPVVGKIPIIKAIREHTNMALKDAKDLVERTFTFPFIKDGF